MKVVELINYYRYHGRMKTNVDVTYHMETSYVFTSLLPSSDLNMSEKKNSTCVINVIMIFFKNPKLNRIFNYTTKFQRLKIGIVN